MSDTETFRLDGQVIPFEPGQTIMEAATAAGVYIPHLCFHADFGPHGSCRLCTVAIAGRHAAACTTPARAGLTVDNTSAELQAHRRHILQMYFAEGTHICPSCEVSGNCQLQALAYYLGMLAPRFKSLAGRRPVDASHPRFVLDRDRCILCELCVRASRDQDGKSVFALGGRGHDTHLIVNTESGLLVDSDLAPDDVAAHVCPVGALMLKHRGYETAIGHRAYDQAGIETVGHRPAMPREVLHDE